MHHKTYASDQIIELSLNPYVAHCTTKSISYTPDCKEKVMSLYNQGHGARESFAILGFPSYVTETSLPRDCIKAWKQRVMKSGLIGLREGKRGRKKKEDAGGDQPGDTIAIKETVEYLKAKIAYLEAENEVFRRIRAGKYQSYSSVANGK